MRSVHKVSASLQNTLPSSRSSPSPTRSRPCECFLGNAGITAGSSPTTPPFPPPLVQYTRQDQHDGIPHLHQDPAAVKAFLVMKQKLMSAPILAYPQFHGKPFILDTDFSINPGAIGGVLSQEQDGQEWVIAYGARRLQPHERNYAFTKGELLAVIFFLQYYKYYLSHRPFILHTDNRALTWIRSLESPTGMILRWLEILACSTSPFAIGKALSMGMLISCLGHCTPPSPIPSRKRSWSVMRAPWLQPSKHHRASPWKR